LKVTLSIIALLFTTLVLGQTSSLFREQWLPTKSELRIVLELADSVYNQNFYRSYGVHGDAFLLNKNKTFNFYRGMYISYSGRWKTDNKGLFYFNSAQKPQSSFYVITFKHYYYLVSESEKEAFVKKFLLLKDKHKNDKPYELKGRIFSGEDQIAIELGAKNYWINWL
jgi:hypothetical protein